MECYSARPSRSSARGEVVSDTGQSWTRARSELTSRSRSVARPPATTTADLSGLLKLDGKCREHAQNTRTRLCGSAAVLLRVDSPPLPAVQLELVADPELARSGEGRLVNAAVRYWSETSDSVPSTSHRVAAGYLAAAAPVPARTAL